MEVDIYIYIFLTWRTCRSPAISPPQWNFMVLLCMKSILVLHKSCCLVYICHAVLKVRTGPAAKTWTETSSGFFIPKLTENLVILLPHLYSDSLCSTRPVRLAQYSIGHSKPCHCVVSCQQLRHLGQGWQSSSGWTAKSALQLHRTDDTTPLQGHITPPVTWCRHPGQMSITEMTVCQAYSKCEEEYVNSALAVTQILGSRQPMATWMSLLSRTKYAWKRQKQAIMRRSSCHWQWDKQKALLSSPALCCLLLLLLFFFSVGLLWWIIALLTWFHNAVTRLSVPVQHNNKIKKSEDLNLNFWHCLEVAAFLHCGV